MKLTSVTFALLAGSAAAAPTASSVSEIVKRASLNDAATGYASQNGGTTGGAGGTTTTVSSYAQFTAAVTGDSKKVVVLNGAINQAAKQVRVGSNTSIIGKGSNAKLTGVGLLIKGKKNVIVRNIAISKVIADNGDAIGVDSSTNVWIDHVDVSSDMNNGKDYYDGLIDITHAGDFVTVSNSYIHDHYKASLVGHSDDNGAEDKGHLRVTYDSNYWKNLNSRGPSFRFGTGHVFNNYYENVSDGINTRQGAQLLVQSNVWSGCKKAIFSTDGGYAVQSGNDFGGAESSAPSGTFTQAPYSYTNAGSGNVKSKVVGKAGVTLTF